MDYLNENQIGIAKSAIGNIKDRLKAIEIEIYTREKPYKSYLNEKLDSIRWDLQVLLNMAKPDRIIKIDKDIKLVIQKVLFDIEEKSTINKVWNEDVFPTYLWNELWNLNEKIINSDVIDEQQYDKLVDIENVLCEKDNIGYFPIDEELHSKFVDILNYISLKLNEQ